MSLTDKQLRKIAMVSYQKARDGTPLLKPRADSASPQTARPNNERQAAPPRKLH